jgi:hypothetical protein
MKRLFKTLANIVRLSLTGWYQMFNHVVDGLERYENTCKKRVKVRKSEQKYEKTQMTRPPWQ